jgi:lipopolysaccharide assembly outer membrane protein LptD (OstA)
MKLLTLFVAMVCQCLIFVPRASCQDSKAQLDRLYITRAIPESGGGRIELAASEVQRDLSNKASESIIQLKGNVELKMITCTSTRREGQVCEGAMVLRADAVEFNEKTGEIAASGHVRITPHRAGAPSREFSK